MRSEVVHESAAGYGGFFLDFRANVMPVPVISEMKFHEPAQFTRINYLLDGSQIAVIAAVLIGEYAAIVDSTRVKYLFGFCRGDGKGFLDQDVFPCFEGLQRKI